MSTVTTPPPEHRLLGFSLSRLNQRRLANFRRNRRGYWSTWIFSFLFLCSLPAEFIANDRPLLVHYDGQLYSPVLFTYPETTFGGDFETEASAVILHAGAHRRSGLDCLASHPLPLRHGRCDLKQLLLRPM